MRVMFAPASDALISCSMDHCLRLWSLFPPRCMRVMEGHTDHVLGVAFNRNAARIASCSHDRTVRIWHTQTGQCLRVLRGHTDVVYDCIFTHDDDRLLSCDHGGYMILWDWRHNIPVRRTLVCPLSWAMSVHACPDGTQFVVACGDHMLRVWRALPATCACSVQ